MFNHSTPPPGMIAVHAAGQQGGAEPVVLPAPLQKVEIKGAAACDARRHEGSGCTQVLLNNPGVRSDIRTLLNQIDRV